MKCAVLGSPIAHSKSPQLHLAGYAFLGLDWSYERIELAKTSLSAFVSKLDKTWAGLSLTMPLKEEALDLADDVDVLAWKRFYSWRGSYGKSSVGRPRTL